MFCSAARMAGWLPDQKEKSFQKQIIPTIVECIVLSSEESASCKDGLVHILHPQRSICTCDGCLGVFRELTRSSDAILAYPTFLVVSFAKKLRENGAHN
ncbi:hypothetical protein GUJ93_ZPchr0013g36860 [Zizania palustris]|uniref:Uncharacterized protein n=1 Tax=Zizania palustris TaxID=103762 RepID=A0A8J5WSP0_ZIZPA|nr:hypothetical protein GUJ93_ZPchr0013g36860 [Zizania palustris]